MTATAVKEHPLLFSPRMVNAILAGYKSQTRRIAASRKNCESVETWLWDRLEFDDAKVPSEAMQTFADDGYLHVACRPHPEDSQDAGNWTRERIYPKWQVGDLIWVREAIWLPPEITARMRREGADTWPRVIYDSDESTDREWLKDHNWRRVNSIHMRRMYCRILLRVTQLRGQKLQDISEGDSRDEGAGPEFEINVRDFGRVDLSKVSTCRLGFKHRWDELNGETYPWRSNCWVWAISFRSVSTGKV